MINEELTEKEEIIEQQFKKNYITCISMLIAMNINTIYKYRKCNSTIIFRNVFNESKDEYVLSKDEEQSLFQNVKDILRKDYCLDVVIDSEGKLQLIQL